MNNDTLKLIARILISIIFILAGFSKFGNIGGTAGYIASIGLPASTALAWLAAIFEAVAGLMILVGFQTRLTSWALAAFCIFTGVVFHNNFGDQTQMILFMKNIAIAGGFILLAVTGAGALSVDGRRGA